MKLNASAVTAAFALLVALPVSAAHVSWDRSFNPKSTYGPNTTVQEVDLNSISTLGEMIVADVYEHRIFEDGYISDPQKSMTVFASCSKGQIKVEHVGGIVNIFTAIAPSFWEYTSNIATSDRPGGGYLLNDDLYLRNKDDNPDQQIRKMWRRNGPGYKKYTQLFELICQKKPMQHDI